MGYFPLLSIFLIFLISACTPGQQNTGQQSTYFDLEGYFIKEAARLQQENPLILKTVGKNDLKEEKRLHIKSWENELGLFLSSGINKSAWKDSYIEQQDSQSIRYTALDSSLRTKKVIVQKDTAGTVKHIYIFNKTSNSLYSSAETLDYYPDSLYMINKRQQVLLIGSNSFEITGRF